MEVTEQGQHNLLLVLTALLVIRFALGLGEEEQAGGPPIVIP